MHYKHNQIFSDHDIPADVDSITFSRKPLTWKDIAKMIEGLQETAAEAAVEAAAD